LVRTTLEQVKCRVKVQNNLSEPSGTSVGLKQGDTFSYILFNIPLEKVVRDSMIETKGALYNKTILILAHAGHIVLRGEPQVTEGNNYKLQYSREGNWTYSHSAKK
jgi:hypothetical protein